MSNQNINMTRSQTPYSLEYILISFLCQDPIHGIFYKIQEPNNNGILHETNRGNSYPVHRKIRDAYPIFETRFYSRPNPIGFSVVRLIQRTGPLLEIQCVDMLDGTPLLDIKPYVPEFDVRTVDNSRLW